MEYICLVWSLLLTVLSFTARPGSGCFNYGQCIFNDIMVNYTPDVRPMRSANDTTVVQVKLVVLSLKAITEITETMDTGGYFRVTWNDHRLTWDPDNYGGVRTITIPAYRLWLPDLVTYNSDTSFYKETYRRDFMVRLNYTGSIFWGYGGILSTSCQINMEDYPFDQQSCDIIVEAWAYMKHEVDLFFQDEGISVNASAYSNQVWTYVGEKVESSLKYGNRYRRLTFTLKWKRKRLYYHTNIILPIALLSLVTLGVFWIPVESGDKVSLAITVMLAFSVFQIVIMDNTPVNSNVIPKITQYVILVTSMATLSLLTSMLVVYINDQVPKRRAPRKLRLLCFKYVAKIFCLSHNKQEKMESDLRRDYASPHTINSIVSNSINVMCRDRINQLPQLNESSETLKKILERLNDLLAHVEESGQSEEIKEEWAYIAKIIDRVLFFLTLTIYVVFVIYIFIL